MMPAVVVAAAKSDERKSAASGMLQENGWQEMHLHKVHRQLGFTNGWL